MISDIAQVCAFRLRWHYARLTEPENIQNVALIQLVAGAFCLVVEVSSRMTEFYFLHKNIRQTSMEH